MAVDTLPLPESLKEDKSLHGTEQERLAKLEAATTAAEAIEILPGDYQIHVHIIMVCCVSCVRHRAVLQ